MPPRQTLFVIAVVAAFQVDTIFAVSCGQLTSRDSSGYLSSPSKDGKGGFTKSFVSSGSYPSSVDCAYSITAPSGTGLRLTWTTFDINGNMPDCTKGDYVEISIGCGYNKQNIGKYCSSNAQRPFDIYSRDNCMEIKFHSNSDNSTGKGFRARFTTFQNNKQYRSYQCTTSSYGKRMSSSYGTISSSYWPGRYPVSYSSCYFKISRSSGRRTKIVFMDFDLARDIGCDDTKIKIKGGGSSYSKAHTTIKDSMCGSKRPFSFTTGEDTIHIRFKSEDINLSHRGFIAGYVTYKPVDGEHSTSTGVIVGIIIAILIVVAIAAVIYCCVVKKRRERSRRAAAHQAVPLAPATYPAQQPPPQQSYAPPPYGQAAGQPYLPPGQEKPPIDSQAAYPPQGYYPPPGGYPPQGGQPYPPPGGQPYPPPGGQPYPPGGQPYPPPPGGQPYPPSSAQPPPYPT